MRFQQKEATCEPTNPCRVGTPRCDSYNQQPFEGGAMSVPYCLISPSEIAFNTATCFEDASSFLKMLRR